jgi:hypothetical protein
MSSIAVLIWMQYNRGRGLPQTYRLCDLKSYLTDPKTAIYCSGRRLILQVRARHCRALTSVPHFRVVLEYFRVVLEYFRVVLKYFRVVLEYFRVVLEYFRVVLEYFRVVLSYFRVVLEYFRVVLKYFRVVLEYFRVVLRYLIMSFPRLTRLTAIAPSKIKGDRILALD